MSKRDTAKMQSGILLNRLYNSTQNKGQCYIGIDPGARSGAVAVTWDVFIPDFYAFDVPVKVEKSGKRHNAFVDVIGIMKKLQPLLSVNTPIVITIENVHSMPNDSKSNAFNFGRNFGSLMALIDALNMWYDITMFRPSPQTWKKEMFGSHYSRDSKSERKELSMEVARQLCSGEYTDFFLQLDKKCSHNKAEAALLALYGARQVKRVTEDQTNDKAVIAS